MTVFDVLQRQQRELDGMFDELQLCDEDQAWYLFQTVATRWVAGMRAEHSIVYPRLATRCGLAAELQQATRDDEQIERAIDHVRLSPMAPVEWREAVRSLRTRIADRATWQQWELCPLAHLTMSTRELATLATAFLAFQPIAMTAAAPSITYDLAAPPARAEPPTVAIPARAA